MLKKAIPGLFQLTKQKTWFLLCSIFQAHKPCLKNGGACGAFASCFACKPRASHPWLARLLLRSSPMHRTQAVFQQPAKQITAPAPA
jgi:hypothetical protein